MAAIPGRVSACSASKCVQPFVDSHTAQVYHSEACSCQAGSCPDQELDMLQPVTQGMLARGVSFISSSVKDHVQRSHWYRHLQAYQRNVHQLLQKWSKPSKVEEELNRGCECCKWLLLHAVCVPFESVVTTPASMVRELAHAILLQAATLSNAEREKAAKLSRATLCLWSWSAVVCMLCDPHVYSTILAWPKVEHVVCGIMYGIPSHHMYQAAFGFCPCFLK